MARYCASSNSSCGAVDVRPVRASPTAASRFWSFVLLIERSGVQEQQPGRYEGRLGTGEIKILDCRGSSLAIGEFGRHDAGIGGVVGSPFQKTVALQLTQLIANAAPELGRPAKPRARLPPSSPD